MCCDGGTQERFSRRHLSLPPRHSRQSTENSDQCHSTTTTTTIITSPDSHQTMSSFLMNSGSYGVSSDPKFPPSDEYSQSSYLHHSEYYNQMQAAHQYGYAGMSGYPSRDPMRDPMGYSNYYQQCSAMSQQQVLADINDKTVRHSHCPKLGKPGGSSVCLFLSIDLLYRQQYSPARYLGQSSLNDQKIRFISLPSRNSDNAKFVLFFILIDNIIKTTQVFAISKE